MSEIDLDGVFEKVRHVVTPAEWALEGPLIEAILAKKRAMGAVILAHNYQASSIFHGVADFVGDSLELAKLARACEAETLVVCGVHFMAETAKLLNPGRRVLLPSLEAGCSLADSITAADVLALRAKYPGVPVVTYVNTTAAVKAVSDICCTSSNAVEVVESLGVSRVIFLPDQHLAGHVARHTDVEIIDWQGGCIVHEEFRASDLRALKEQYPEIAVIVHPECREDVQALADYVGSTSGLVHYVAREKPSKVALITECTMSANVAERFGDVEFIQPCSLCPYMRKITLENILAALEKGQHEIVIPAEVEVGARLAVERMLEVGARRL